LGVLASEGYFGNPYLHGTDLFVPTLCLNYFEYVEEDFTDLPLDEITKHLIKMNQLEVGKVYEVVVTNPNGLYRYRMKDLYKINKFIENNIPVFEFCNRKEFVVVNDTKVSSNLKKKIFLI
jgi:hypothetical protein